MYDFSGLKILNYLNRPYLGARNYEYFYLGKFCVPKNGGICCSEKKLDNIRAMLCVYRMIIG